MRSPVGPHRERRGRVRIRGREAGACDRHGQHAARRAAGVRIEHVPAARVVGRRRHREVADLQDLGDLAALERVLDADRPAAAADDEVAARIHGVPPNTGRVEQRSRTVDRPSLDEAGRIEQLGRRRACVEVAVCRCARLLAEPEHRHDTLIGISDLELAAVDAADLAVGLVRAEDAVDPPEPPEDVVDDALVDGVVGNVDEDRHSHDVLDALHQTFFAASSAAWSDWLNA